MYDYRGCRYKYEDDYEENNIKRFHFCYVFIGDVEIFSCNIPLSPYSKMTEELFKRWVQAGRPTREKLGGHHIEDHNKYWNTLFGEAIDKILLGEDDE